VEPVRPDLVEYLIVVAPDGESLGSVADAVATLNSSDLIRLLDLVVVAKDEAGDVTVLEGDAADALAAQASGPGVAEGLLTNADIELAAQAVAPGTTAMLVVLEDRWAEVLSSAVRGVGGEIVAGERIPRARVAAALAERTEGG
jgi:uncharacterized membrane protein